MIQKFYKVFIPKFLKEKIYKVNLHQYLEEQARRREEIEQGLPQIELSPIYIGNLRVLANLNELLRMMPKNATVAQYGVDLDALSERIITISAPKKLYLLETMHEPFHQSDIKEAIRNKYNGEIQSGVIYINDGDPFINIEKIPDSTLDWIFLRTDSSYLITTRLLDISLRKVKTDGMITGCNYGIGHWESMQRYGVIEAVNKFCKDHGWELIYLTNESNRLLNFALRKISQGG